MSKQMTVAELFETYQTARVEAMTAWQSGRIGVAEFDAIVTSLRLAFEEDRYGLSSLGGE